MRFLRWVSLCTLGVISMFAVQAATHPFSVHDMLAMQRISDPQLSPAGDLLVFGLRTTDLEADRGRSDLWLVDVDGSGLRQLTSHPASEFNPRWSVDGKSIYFISTRSESSQIWRIPVDGGEALQLTDEPLDITSLAVSPDGGRIAYSMDVFPSCGDTACTKQKLDEVAAQKASGRIFEKLIFRHWDTWKDGRRSHLFVRSLTKEDAVAVDVMRGMDADCPSKPFGGPEEYTFTPDGTAIVFSAKDAGREEAWSTNFDLYVVPADASGNPKNLTAANLAWDTAPVFSPDGKTLAYLAMTKPGYEADRYRIKLISWPHGTPKVLTEEWDRSPYGLAWSSDSKRLYANANNVGQRSLFSIDANSGTVTTVVEEGSVSAFAEAGKRVVYALAHLRSPVELYSVARDGTDARRITHINDERVAAARMGETEQFQFKGWNDEIVYAWVVKPVDYEPGKTYPVAFVIHGGPQGSSNNGFHYRWNPQAYAGAGYGAVMVDFHGSTGYGQAFSDAIREDWGGKPLVDLQRGLAAALERYDWLDGDRVAGLGASYGGYMVNWIEGNWPDRFRCLVNHDGNLDERLAYFDTEELWFPEWDHGGTPWDNPEGYEKHNPLNFVKNWSTPMLVIHGALDYRVVETQGFSTFTVLQRMNIPSKLLYFPDENHWVLKPANGILWHETAIDWIDRWTKDE
jgi:dipeptidyl aminopeptidase/acylaminoacyl peptidase